MLNKFDEVESSLKGRLSTQDYINSGFGALSESLDYFLRIVDTLHTWSGSSLLTYREGWSEINVEIGFLDDAKQGVNNAVKVCRDNEVFKTKLTYAAYSKVITLLDGIDKLVHEKRNNILYTVSFTLNSALYKIKLFQDNGVYLKAPQG